MRCIHLIPRILPQHIKCIGYTFTHTVSFASIRPPVASQQCLYRLSKIRRERHFPWSVHEHADNGVSPATHRGSSGHPNQQRSFSLPNTKLGIAPCRQSDTFDSQSSKRVPEVKFHGKRMGKGGGRIILYHRGSNRRLKPLMKLFLRHLSVSKNTGTRMISLSELGQ